MKNYEEKKEWSTFWSWFTIFAISGSLLIWAMLMMSSVETVPREWDFGNIEYTPAKSLYSTHKYIPGSDELMMDPLPDGVSMEEQEEQQSKLEQ